MKKTIACVIVILMFLGMLMLFAVNAASALAPAWPVEFARQLGPSANSYMPRSTETLTPTIFLPLVCLNCSSETPPDLRVQFGSSSYSVYENTGTATVTATLSAVPSVTVTVDYATSGGTAEAGSDYVAISDTLSFAPGQTSQTLTVTVNDDTFDEPDEAVNLTLSDPVNAVLGAVYTATLTIVDNDEPPMVQFSSSSYSVYEGTGTATVIATLSTASDVTVTVDYATSDGTAEASSDYVPISGTLRFAPGQMSQTFAVTVNDDTFDEPDEIVNLTLSDPVNAVLGTVYTSTLTIVDNDEPPMVQFSSSSYSVYEGTGMATVIVTLGASSGVTVTVDYVTSDGTAEASSDYVPISGTLRFAPGQTSRTFAVTVNDDTFDEPDETINLTLGDPVNAVLGTVYTSTLTIVDNDEPPMVQFSSSSYSVYEGTGTATVITTLSAPSSVTVTVDYATSDGTAEAGSDYVAISGTLRFAPGQTSRTFAVTVNDDAFNEPDETINLTLGNPVSAVLGTVYTATLTIVDSGGPPAVQFNSNSYSVYEGTGTATVIATLSATSTMTVTVDYATSDGTAEAGSDYVAVSGTLRFAPGQMNQTFTVTVNDDMLDELDETVNLTLSDPVSAVLGTVHTATLTIMDSDGPPAVQFSSSSYSVYEGTGAATVIATLSTASGVTITVDYATSDGTAEASSDYVPISGTLSFAPGQMSQTFTMTVNDDMLDEPDETVNLTLSDPVSAVLGTVYTTTLTIVDDDEPPMVQFSSSSYSVYEGTGTATVITTLSAASAMTVTVDYAASDGTAEAGSDYVTISGTLRFAPGQTSRTFAVTVNDDAFDEPDETVDLTLSDPVSAVLGTVYTATLTIVDNDEPPMVQFSSSSYSVYEGTGTATVTATLSAPSGVTVTVEYTTSGGTAEAGIDYVAISGTLSFVPGETSQTYVLEIFNDPFDETDETLTLTLYNPVSATLGTPDPALLTIVDEDVPSRFGLQIAALHEVTPDVMEWENGAFVGPQTEAEWLALYQSAYVTLTTALRESGAGWARMRVEWKWIEPNAPEPDQPPDYVWGPYHDVKLRLVAEAGVRLIATVSGVPDWAVTGEPCDPIRADRLDEFARFLTDLVNHYRRPPYYIKHWELFNEPDYDGSEGNNVGYACYGNDGDLYAQMLAVAYPAIKAADPEATVLMGGLAYDRFTEYGGPFLRYFPDEVMDNGGGAYVDVLNFHYFHDFHAEWERWGPGDPPTCGIVDDGVGAPYEAWGIDLIAKTNHFRNRMSTCFGVDKPVWVTEMSEHGFPDDPDSLVEQARYVIQGNVRGLAAGAENLTWYALTTPNDPWEFQLLFDDWEPKPAFYTYQTLTSELSGYEYASALDVPDVEGYIFEDASQQEKTVAWGSGTLTFAPAGQLRVVDREGNATFINDGGAGDVDGVQNGAVELQLSDDPVFVTVSG